MCRGDRHEAIFLDDADRERFLETLVEARERTGWRIHAYVLMVNHYHLLLETPEANLMAGMRWFQGTYPETDGGEQSMGERPTGDGARRQSIEDGEPRGARPNPEDETAEETGTRRVKNT